VPERAAAIGASAVQIFSGNPTAWQRRAKLPPELPVFRRRLAELDIAPLAIHAAYLANLASPDDALFRRSVELLRHELGLAPHYGARFLNVHAGSHRGAGREAGIARLIDGAAQVLDGIPGQADAPLLVIENASGGGDRLGSTLDELAAIHEAAAARGLAGRLGFCLDTAHLWGAGYDISDPATVDALVAEFDRRIGLDRLVMIHLNDSHSARGSRHDRHAHLGDGHIGRQGLARWLCHPAVDRAVYYFETPHMEDGFDAINMARLADLATGRPLTPGPSGSSRPDREPARRRPIGRRSRAPLAPPG
jgi:deoxyribonuclease-4